MMERRTDRAEELARARREFEGAMALGVTVLEYRRIEAERRWRENIERMRAVAGRTGTLRHAPPPGSPNPFADAPWMMKD